MRGKTKNPFAGAMRRARRAAGWSQVKLEMESGVGRDMISAYENGRYEPGLYNAISLAEALGTGLGEYLGAMEDRPRRRVPQKLTVGESMRRARESVGWSIVQLSKKSGANQGNICLYEGDKAVPMVSTALRLARTLGIGLDEYVGFLQTAREEGGAERDEG